MNLLLLLLLPKAVSEFYGIHLYLRCVLEISAVHLIGFTKKFQLALAHGVPAKKSNSIKAIHDEKNKTRFGRVSKHTQL